ncbi:tRNA-uridine aminocarboxypropyltransferase 2 [Tripterygium wilfordii]|uniref:tRNA-uridine aminocarboxypropyltransferase 2 n=1 Tax=Tripterygium wilfordii TaxID=458696 RepID=UPI0018F7F907|nr:tRNA-uridine aminocarboxypropyltransferase 2 [Tripterygium wilfordii]
MEENTVTTTADFSATTATDTSPPPQRRSICGNCSRPLPVCLCHALPASPIPTATQIIIVQHPHESHHKLNTIPLLTRSLLHATAFISRKLRPNLHPLLDSLRNNINDNDHSPRAIYLFPPSSSSPAVSLSELKNMLNEGDGGRGLVLIVFDATWKHAREMVKASEGYLGQFALRVCLDGGLNEEAEGGSIYESELVLRKEPCGGCVTTAEAVARFLRVVEPNGPEIESKIIGSLREMVRLQARFLKPMKPRPRLLRQSNQKD